MGKQSELINEIGNRHGTLVVIDRSPSTLGYKTRWLCRCDCGKETSISGHALRHGDVDGCKCCKGVKKSKYGRYLIGGVYGRLTVVENMGTVSNRKHGSKTYNTMWMCRCECGKYEIREARKLRGGNLVNLSCGCGIIPKVYPGVVIGNVTVLRAAGRDRCNSQWLCRCNICGTEKVKREYAIKNRPVTTCRCLFSKDTVTSGFNRVYDHYRRHSESLGRSWELTKDDVRNLTSKNCFYCGHPPNNVKDKNRQAAVHKGINPLSKNVGKFVYNGIDRVDSEKGYTMANVVTCCTTCNLAKRSMSVDEFAAWVRDVYKWARGWSI
jgi:5-methylcytosine-specific restriction endonuclease McrA